MEKPGLCGFWEQGCRSEAGRHFCIQCRSVTAAFTFLSVPDSGVMSPFHRRRGRQIHGSPSKALRNSASEPAIFPALSLFFFLFLIAAILRGACFAHAGSVCVRLPYPHYSGLKRRPDALIAVNTRQFSG